MTSRKKPTKKTPDSNYVLSTLSGNVLLIGGYGAGNIGDEAILSGLLREASERIETLSVISHNPEETRQLHESTVPDPVSFKPIEPSIPELAYQMINNDHILIGGGGIFSRYMGPYAKKIPYYTIVAQTLQRSVHWTALGVYPSTPNSVMRPLCFSMNRSTSVTVRDPISQSTLENKGISNVQLVPDPALSLSPDINAGMKVLENIGVENTDKIIGVAARRVMDDSNNRHLQEMYREITEHFINEGWEVIFIPFCRHPYEKVEQDDEVCKRLASEYEPTEVVSYKYPDELLGIISHLDALVATRLHSMIFAYITETPFVSVEYADKCSSLLKHYGMESRGIGLDEVGPDSVIEKLEEI